MGLSDPEHSADDEDGEHAHKRAKSGKQGKAKPGLGASTAPGPSRTRPTNNQLLYKAHFRLQHMNLTSTVGMVEDTDACPSVASCFLQVLQGLQKAEQLHPGGSKRNILQILSSNTRRTKVVELSSGTHRIPDELKRNYLTDGSGGQYSTNLDRNRYGSDDCYLHTVIRYDLEYLALCPCSVDVEIIDSKAGNASTLVRCGLEGCSCSNKAQHIAAEAAAEGVAPASTAAAASAPLMTPLSVAGATTAAAMAAPTMPRGREAAAAARNMAGRPRPNSPQRSTNSGSSGLFDALMPAAGHNLGAMPALGGLPDATAPPSLSLMDPKPDGSSMMAPGTGAMLLPFAQPQAPSAPQPQPQQGQPVKMEPPSRRQRPAPQKSRSRLWSMLSQGELDSIQNALDEYVTKGGGMDDEIFSGPNGLRLLPADDGDAADPAAETNAKVGTKRKPPRNNNSFLLMGADSTAFSGLSKLGLGLFEDESDDSLRQEEIAGKLQSPLLPSLEEGGETGVGTASGSGKDTHEQEGAQAKHGHHRPVSRQFTVSSIGVAGAAFDRMAAEVEALKAENQRLKQAVLAKGHGVGSSAVDAAREFELEQQLMEGRSEMKHLKDRVEAAEQREQSAQAHVRALEERNAALVTELNKTQADVNALLTKLSGSTLQFGNTFLADQFQNTVKQRLPSGGNFEFNSQLALLQQQQQQQQRQHDSGLFGVPQPSAMLSAQGHPALGGQAQMLSSLHSTPLGMSLPLGHSR